ncbi:MAG: polysaccharide deacetylase family protein [Pseudodesulfovibrio sp.]|nr:polysaccharide deacetylase family protein [Pseudodesulfovibrio sp.]
MDVAPINRIKRLIGFALRGPEYMSRYLFPQSMWKWYDALARKAGLRQLYFVLSFDCDTVKDAAVVLDVDEKLRDMGVKPVYAVPGEVLSASASVYQELAARGAEFINHGYVLHTTWDAATNQYDSCFFYDDLSVDELRRDIEQGHEAILDILGVSAVGFRAPHFGCVREQQLREVHGVLQDLGYRFSSSTIPEYAFTHGSVFSDFGLVEFPVSGWWRQPYNIQDSWGYMAAPGASLGAEGYYAHARETANQFRKRGHVGILNYYADPSQVYDKPEFFEAVKCWNSVATSTTYGGIMDDLAELNGVAKNVG